MAKNTIGQFISALRKANGMTQQEVADRLNVSNKAVSRWERDECAPDISLIPAIAEMFSVTCDELLKGERISNTFSEEKKEAKVEKQLKSLIDHTVTDFKTMNIISIAIALSGFIAMFGITYGFYRSVIGFAVMSVFEICAIVVYMLALNKAKSAKNDNELFNEADVTLIQNFNQKLGSLSFLSLFCVVSVFIAALPISFPFEIFRLFMRHFYPRIVIEGGVLTFESYVSVFLPGVIFIIALLHLVFKRPYIAWVSGQKSSNKHNIKENICENKMSILQIAFTLFACIMFFVAPYFDRDPNKTSLLYNVISVFGLGCLAMNIVCFVAFVVKNKEKRSRFVLNGIRNICLIPATFLIPRFHTSIWTSYDETNDCVWSISWNNEYFLYMLVYVLIVFIAFSIINTIISRKFKKK